MKPNFVQHLSERLSAPLPGRDAHLKMVTSARLAEVAQIRHADAPKVACVLNLLFQRNNDWHLVLIKRTTHPNDRHSGQISFPGGRYEENDGALVNVALREAEEEIGVLPENINIIGRLTELYIPVSNFLVHPFVGVLEHEPLFIPQPTEVESILLPPVHIFQNPENIKTGDLKIANGQTVREVRYFDVHGRSVWGATAMILSEFLEIIK